MIYPFESMDKYFASQFASSGREWHTERMTEMINLLTLNTTLPLEYSYPFTLQRLYWLRANLDNYEFSDKEKLRELIEFDIVYYENDKSQYFYGYEERRTKKDVLLQKLDTPDSDGYIFPAKLFEWLPTHIQFVMGWPDYKKPELNICLGVATNLVVKDSALYGTFRLHGYNHEDFFLDDNYFSYSIFGPTVFGTDGKTVEKFILHRAVAIKKESVDIADKLEKYYEEADAPRRIFMGNISKILGKTYNGRDIPYK